MTTKNSQNPSALEAALDDTTAEKSKTPLDEVPASGAGVPVATSLSLGDTTLAPPVLRATPIDLKKPRALGAKRKQSAASPEELPDSKRPAVVVESTRLKVQSPVRKSSQTSAAAVEPTRLDTVAAVPAAAEMTLNVLPLLGTRFSVVLSTDCTLYDLKETVTVRTSIPRRRLLLIEAASSRLLEDDEAFLHDLGLRDGSCINLSVKVMCGIETPTFVDFYDSDDELLLCEIVVPSGSDNELERAMSPSLLEELDVLSAAAPRRLSRTESLESLRIVEGCPEPGLAVPVDDAVFSLEQLRVRSDPPEEPAVPVTSTFTGRSTCLKCQRKCRLAQRFECRCGGTFCPQHRYCDQHECGFDYKEHGRAGLQEANPRINKPKLAPI